MSLWMTNPETEERQLKNPPFLPLMKIAGWRLHTLPARFPAAREGTAGARFTPLSIVLFQIQKRWRVGLCGLGWVGLGMLTPHWPSLRRCRGCAKSWPSFWRKETAPGFCGDERIAKASKNSGPQSSYWARANAWGVLCLGVTKKILGRLKTHSV